MLTKKINTCKTCKHCHSTGKYCNHINYINKISYNSNYKFFEVLKSNIHKHLTESPKYCNLYFYKNYINLSPLKIPNGLLKGPFMSTRGSYGLRMNGIDKIMYNHSDSYPKDLGKYILNFIKTQKHKELVDLFNFLRLININKKPTHKQIEKCKPVTNLGVSKQSVDDWYCLLHETQGKLETMLPPNGIPYFKDGSYFLKDSLHCEWAYIINLDDNVLEIYRGLNEHQNGRGRYASLFKPKNKMVKYTDPIHKSVQYYGVVLIASIPLDIIYFWDDEKIVDACKAFASNDQVFTDGWIKENVKDIPEILKGFIKQ